MELLGTLTLYAACVLYTPYDVQWGGVDPLALFADTYLVHIVDSIGCFHTETYDISQGNQIVSNEVLYHPICNGDANGSISIDITGGTGLLSYDWLNSTSTADSLFGLVNGVYPLTVVDAVGCIDTFYFTLQSPPLLELNLIVLDSILPCFGDLTVVYAMISGGTSPYFIGWTDGDSSSTSRVLGAGSYGVQVMDSNNCLITDYFAITEPDSLEIITTYTNMSCI